MIYFLYDILLWVALVGIIPYHLYRSASRGRRAAFAERFGSVSRERVATLGGKEIIWVHAVSVGETMAAKPLLKALRQRFPEKKIVLSNVTETGRSIGEKLPEVDLCIYLPFDYRFAVRRVLQALRPSLVVIVETEIWPNFLRTAAEMGIPSVMVNGRISDRSFGRYLKLGWFFRPVLAHFSALCMQTDEDARRITAIGAAPARVHVTKNLKYDLPSSVLSPEQRSLLKKEYGIPVSLPVLTAGSTHAGEEEMVLAAYRAILAAGHACLLILVPRHPERAPQVGDLLRKDGIPFTLRSELEGTGKDFHGGEVLLVDRVGELMRLYSLSDLVFVGGSLVPTGGHNVLEPASLGVPVVFGPHMSNFREIAAMILEAGGGIQVPDGTELAVVLEGLLTDGERRTSMGRRGVALMDENRGATDRHMEIIASLLK
ncbi:MAG: 3-deoxy-D-manno-octulosonic acid transferase [Geobacter sp.]|nr:MAG: 3-deoxy-D-manno-octulosonic acid transferase [Geobacter sp.]